MYQIVVQSTVCIKHYFIFIAQKNKSAMVKCKLHYAANATSHANVKLAKNPEWC